MDLEQAEELAAVAHEDWDMALGHYIRQVRGEGSPEQITAARADALAALHLWRTAQEMLGLAVRRDDQRQAAALERLPIGESGQWLERGEGEP